MERRKGVGGALIQDNFFLKAPCCLFFFHSSQYLTKLLNLLIPVSSVNISMLIFQDYNHEQRGKKGSQHLQTAVLLFLQRWGRLCVGFAKPFLSLPPLYLASA